MLNIEDQAVSSFDALGIESPFKREFFKGNWYKFNLVYNLNRLEKY